MRYDLTVTQSFGDRNRGDRITGEAEKAEALANNAHCVVRVAALPEAPAEEPAPDKTDPPARVRP